MPGRSTVDDGDCLAANAGLDAGFVAQVGGDPAVAELADAGEVEVGNRGHPATLTRAQPARRRRVLVDAGSWVGSVWRSRAMEVSDR